MRRGLQVPRRPAHGSRLGDAVDVDRGLADLAGQFPVGERQSARAIRERRAVVALNPVDKAEAYYQLALAYRDAGATADARRNVVRALEDAPHFERAQELLLQLHEGRKP